MKNVDAFTISPPTGYAAVCHAALASDSQMVWSKLLTLVYQYVTTCVKKTDNSPSRQLGRGQALMSNSRICSSPNTWLGMELLPTSLPRVQEGAKLDFSIKGYQDSTLADGKAGI